MEALWSIRESLLSASPFSYTPPWASALAFGFLSWRHEGCLEITLSALGDFCWLRHLPRFCSDALRETSKCSRITKSKFYPQKTRVTCIFRLKSPCAVPPVKVNKVMFGVCGSAPQQQEIFGPAGKRIVLYHYALLIRGVDVWRDFTLRSGYNKLSSD